MCVSLSQTSRFNNGWCRTIPYTSTARRAPARPPASPDHHIFCCEARWEALNLCCPARAPPYFSSGFAKNHKSKGQSSLLPKCLPLRAMPYAGRGGGRSIGHPHHSSTSRANVHAPPLAQGFFYNHLIKHIAFRDEGEPI